MIAATAPDEIYHLAAPAFVPDSWSPPPTRWPAIATVSGELIDAVREHAPAARVVVATSREIFGADARRARSARTRRARRARPMGSPSSPRTSWSACRAHNGLHMSSAILFNHESPRRHPQFLSRKVTAAAAAISLGTPGRADARRSRGRARLVGRARHRARPAPDGGGTRARRLRVRKRRRAHRARARRRPRSPASGWMSSATCGSTRRWCARPRDPWRSATTARARSASAGAPQISFEQLIAEMVDADLAALRRPERLRLR